MSSAYQISRLYKVQSLLKNFIYEQANLRNQTRIPSRTMHKYAQTVFTRCFFLYGKQFSSITSSSESYRKAYIVHFLQHQSQNFFLPDRLYIQPCFVP